MALPAVVSSKMPNCAGRRIFVWSALHNTSNVTALREGTRSEELHLLDPRQVCPECRYRDTKNNGWSTFGCSFSHWLEGSSAGSAACSWPKIEIERAARPQPLAREQHSLYCRWGHVARLRGRHYHHEAAPSEQASATLRTRAGRVARRRWERHGRHAAGARWAQSPELRPELPPKLAVRASMA